MFDLSPKQRAEVFAMICIVDSFSGGVGKSANLSSRGLGNSFIIGLLVWHVIVLEIVAVLTSLAGFERCAMICNTCLIVGPGSFSVRNW